MGRYHMSADERRRILDGPRPAMEGRDEFVRDNAVSLLKQRDDYIRRLRKRARQLQRSNETYRERDREHRAAIANLNFSITVMLAEERLRRMTDEEWTKVLLWAADFESRAKTVPPHGPEDRPVA